MNCETITTFRPITYRPWSREEGELQVLMFFDPESLDISALRGGSRNRNILIALQIMFQNKSIPYYHFQDTFSSRPMMQHGFDVLP